MHSTTLQPVTRSWVDTDTCTCNTLEELSPVQYHQKNIYLPVELWHTHQSTGNVGENGGGSWRVEIADMTHWAGRLLPANRTTWRGQTRGLTMQKGEAKTHVHTEEDLVVSLAWSAPPTSDLFPPSCWCCTTT